MSVDLSNRLLTSTNGSDAVQYDLPWELLAGFQNDKSYMFTKDPALIEKEAWRTYITDCDDDVFPFLSFSKDSIGIEAERNIDIFTERVLILLCIKTNAIVVCTPTRACSLGMSFGKAAGFLASTYDGYGAFFTNLLA